MLQKRAIRIVVGAKYRDHTKLIFCHLKCLNVRDLLYINIAVTMFNVFNNKVCIRIQNGFKFVSDLHRHKTKSSKSNNYFINQANFSYTLKIRVTIIWNEKSNQRNHFLALKNV